MVLPRGETDEWAHASSQLHVLRIQPDTAEIVGHEPVEKIDPGEPDWLPSIEKQMLGRYQDDPYVTYITGNRGTGCVNSAECRVRMVPVDVVLSFMNVPYSRTEWRRAIRCLA